MPHVRSRLFISIVLTALLAACTKYVPKAKEGSDGFKISRVNLLDSIPAVVPGGSVLNISFHQVTFDGSRMIGRVGGRGERVVRFSVDGGETFVELGAMGPTQTDWDWEVPRVDSDAAMIQLVAKSARGSETLIQSPIFEIRSSGPVLSQTRRPFSSFSNTNSVIFGGGCESPYAVSVFKQTTTGLVKLGEAPCTGNVWEFTVSATVDGPITYRFEAEDSVGHHSFVNATWTRDTIAPVLAANSFNMANGAASVVTNYVPTALDASDADTNVTHFCLAYVTSNSETANVANCRWVAVNDPDQPALIPARTLALRNFLYRLGYLAGTYFVSAWVRDAAGNVSNRLEKSILYNPGVPPTVINVLGSKSDPPVMPFTASDLTVPQGTAVTIRWKIAQAPNGLSTTPVSLYYTSDDETFTPIVEGISDAAHGGCTLAGGLSTGCYVWTSPVASTSYFRVRVAIQDRNGMVASSSTNPLNGAGLSLIAGNTDAGIGASANAAIFLSPRFGYIHGDGGSFVVDNRGYIFFRDTEKGILWVKPSDGIVRVLMPVRVANGAQTYEGPLPHASGTVRFASRIALDYSNGLLIWDYDRIRRIDLETMTVSTLVGGGTSTADDVLANQVNFTPRGGLIWQNHLSPLVPLPNGNILFESEGYWSPAGRLRVYSRHNGKVNSIRVSGSGHTPLVDDGLEDLTTCQTVVVGTTHPCKLTGFAMEYHPVTSVLQTLQVQVVHVIPGNSHYAMANLIPTGSMAGTSQAPHPPAAGYTDRTQNRIMGRDGKIYGMLRAHGRISRFDKASNSWITLVGTSSGNNSDQGVCPDGTPALSCSITPSDAFVDAQSNLFFLDRGRIRTVDGSQRVITIYGQSFFFGDGGLALSARFDTIPHLDVAGDGEVTISDTAESRLRAFMPGGNIQTIAGNGKLQVYPADATIAVNEPYNVAAAGVEQSAFRVNPLTKDVYTSNFRSVAVLNRATGRWQVGPSLAVVGAAEHYYIPNILGFDGTNMLVHTSIYDHSTVTHSDAYLRHVNPVFASNPTPIPSFAGVDGSVTNSFCNDGTPVATCIVPRSAAVGASQATWDGPRQRWLLQGSGSTLIKSLPRAPGATVSTLRSLSRGSSAFAYVNDAQGERVYYCGNDGKLYRGDVGATGADTALPWRIPSMTCRGYSLVYRASTGSLIFPVKQTGLYGVAEYVLP